MMPSKEQYRHARRTISRITMRLPLAAAVNILFDRKDA